MSSHQLWLQLSEGLSTNLIHCKALTPLDCCSSWKASVHQELSPSSAFGMAETSVRLLPDVWSFVDGIHVPGQWYERRESLLVQACSHLYHSGRFRRCFLENP